MAESKIDTCVEFEVELSDGVSDSLQFNVDPDLGLLAVFLQFFRNSSKEE